MATNMAVTLNIPLNLPLAFQGVHNKINIEYKINGYVCEGLLIDIKWNKLKLSKIQSSRVQDFGVMDTGYQLV